MAAFVPEQRPRLSLAERGAWPRPVSELRRAVILGQRAMYWTLSEFLNTIELCGKSWSFMDLAHGAAFRMPHADAIHLYAAVQGSVRLAGVGSKSIAIAEGDVVFVLSGEAHSIRQKEGAQTLTLPMLQDGRPFDRPETIALGEGATAARLLCGSLQVRWPSGQRLRGLPAWLRISPEQNAIVLANLLRTVRSDGGTALLNHAATLLLVNGLREHPRCRALFEEGNRLDPIARAQRFIELHPFHPWSVEILARKVGMSRSNFCARFSAQTGTTPMDLLVRKRMDHAAELLTMTDLKIAEVGERIGYRSEAGFHHRFTAFFGMPPGKLRQQRRRSTPGACPTSSGPIAEGAATDPVELPRHGTIRLARPAVLAPV